jgi:uncharacterized lipoprotein YmbA
MVTRVLLLSLFLIVSCGKDVSLSTKSLEYNSGLSDGTTTATTQEGIVQRGSPDYLNTNGISYKVSIYSSYAALEFIAAKPLSSQIPVKFRGKIKNNEMILEYVTNR